MSYSDAALLLLGHGSTLNGDSNGPTYQHAEEIRRRGIFAEVQVAFWKEEPNFRQALSLVSSQRVFIVPNFISSGYFTEQIIPRELGLTGPVTHRDGRTLLYTEPVGLHPAMTEALLQRAGEVVAASGEMLGEPGLKTCLFICGHGTSFNDNSTKIIHEQAEKIRALGRFADCQAVLMEQAPFVKDWRTLTACPEVVVVPFFIADGLHSFEDIPVLLGLTVNRKEQAFLNPHREPGRRLWYASAIGTEKYLADVILAQVEKCARDTSQLEAAVEVTKRGFSVHTFPVKVGQILILADATLRHQHDAGTAPEALQELGSLEELREIIKSDEAGNFRPLHAAPNLRTGWRYGPLTAEQLQLALDYLYPGAGAQPPGPITAWKETAERQTGRFRIVRELGENEVLDLVKTYCEPGCRKQRLWSPAEQTQAWQAGEIPLLCPEACNFFIGKAREKLKGGAEE